MASGSEIMIKSLMKSMGVNPDEIRTIAEAIMASFRQSEERVLATFDRVCDSEATLSAELREMTERLVRIEAALNASRRDTVTLRDDALVARFVDFGQSVKAIGSEVE